MGVSRIVLTEHERDQVVELLRCAADLYNIGEVTPRSIATAGVVDEYHRSYIKRLAREAEADVIGCDDRTRALLEAAQRVEEGSWP